MPYKNPEDARRWRKANTGKVRVIRARYRATHRVQRREEHERWRAAHREQVRAKERERWPERIARIKQRRRGPDRWGHLPWRDPTVPTRHLSCLFVGHGTVCKGRAVNEPKRKVTARPVRRQWGRYAGDWGIKFRLERQGPLPAPKVKEVFVRVIRAAESCAAAP